MLDPNVCAICKSSEPGTMLYGGNGVYVCGECLTRMWSIKLEYDKGKNVTTKNPLRKKRTPHNFRVIDGGKE